MDSYMDSPRDEDYGADLYLDNFMSSSQISNLDLSSRPPSRGRTLPTPPSSRPSSGKLYQPAPRYVAPPASESRWQHTHDLNRNTREHIRQDSPDSIDSWESDADFVDRRQVPRHTHQSQQDLAERINNLTRTINANAAFCVEVSGKMVKLARENKHLLDGTISTLDTYVLKPGIGMLKTYYPNLQDGLHDGFEVLKEYEAQLRRTVQNCTNGRDMARAQGVSGTGMMASGGSSGKREMNRLKDRLVEQDALLRDSNQYMLRLMQQRDEFKKQLDRQGHDNNNNNREGVDLIGLNADDPAETDPSQLDIKSHQTREEYEEDDEEKRNMTMLQNQLRELHVLVSQLQHDKASNHERRLSSANNGKPREDLEADNEDSGWTLL
ncbi:hypothetical protein PFICI_10269 [Pestalotiopsis fici W106-1]|uniref:Uncharacterized protein n=1 Tax=Pestalotiopsis fici (strain W106-1 / CGMCC3.15140) TaxID=1229662 RepID=W3WYK9_PESFW|nr:uncharacterized protein PFICI_10269 [Pestalotiopsis fici W106-1]ETS78207.1 hypothetical protein PFICI_10269 [Pestalotiopsis fici W106-1]